MTPEKFKMDEIVCKIPLKVVDLMVLLVVLYTYMMTGCASHTAEAI